MVYECQRVNLFSWLCAVIESFWREQSLSRSSSLWAILFASFAYITFLMRERERIKEPGCPDGFCPRGRLSSVAHSSLVSKYDIGMWDRRPAAYGSYCLTWELKRVVELWGSLAEWIILCSSFEYTTSPNPTKPGNPTNILVTTRLLWLLLYENSLRKVNIWQCKHFINTLTLYSSTVHVGFNLGAE